MAIKRIHKENSDFFFNSRIHMSTRMRMLYCYIWSVLLCGCESWTLSNVIEKRLEAAEMWFLRRMLRISWTMKVKNEVLQHANTKRHLMDVCLGHGLKNLVMTGKIEERETVVARGLFY